MKYLLARFSLFMFMIVGIAGASLVEGGEQTAISRIAALECETGTLEVSMVEPVKHRRVESGRLVRWQSLLPGAFR